MTGSMSGGGRAHKHLYGEQDAEGLREAVGGRRVDVDERDGEGRTPLHVVAGRAEWLRQAWTPLSDPGHERAFAVNLEMAGILLGAGADVNAARAGDGWTPVEIAYFADDVKMVELLTGSGAELRERRGWTLLRRSVRGRQSKMAVALICGGADVNETVGCFGCSVLGEVVERWGKAEVVGSMLEHGADVGYRDAVSGGTLLHVVAKTQNWGRVECLGLLVGAGVDVNGVNKRGETALHVACRAGGCGEVVRALLGRGAHVNARDARGQTALHVACRRNPDNIQPLIENGADPAARDQAAESPHDVADKCVYDLAERVLRMFPRHSQLLSELHEHPRQTVTLLAQPGGPFHHFEPLLRMGRSARPGGPFRDVEIGGCGVCGWGVVGAGDKNAGEGNRARLLGAGDKNAGEGNRARLLGVELPCGHGSHAGCAHAWGACVVCDAEGV